MTLLARIACRLGWHRWTPLHPYDNQHSALCRYCERCDLMELYR